MVPNTANLKPVLSPMKIRFTLWALMGLVLLIALVLLKRDLATDLSAGKRATVVALFAMCTAVSAYGAVHFGLRRAYQNMHQPLPPQVVIAFLLFYAVTIAVFVAAVETGQHQILKLLLLTNLSMFGTSALYSGLIVWLLRKQRLEVPMLTQLRERYGNVLMLDSEDITRATSRSTMVHRSIHPDISFPANSFWEKEGYILKNVPWDTLDIPRLILDYCMFLAFTGETIQKDGANRNPVTNAATEFVTYNDSTAEATLHRLCFSTTKDGSCTIFIVKTCSVEILGTPVRTFVSAL
ncbi:MAG: hypothetical protein RL150_382 [Candidatus Parcubacteria bacterium]|jgi:hypothetical protein